MDKKKRIVICMDGTWQNLAWQMLESDPVTGNPVDRRTNVAKIAQQASSAGDDGKQQIVFYSPGVGARTFVTKDKKIARYEGATGEGAEENLIAAYMFLSFNYDPGDEIFLFGFSRGAFCVRSLAGLIRRCGILKRTDTQNIRNALDLYRMRRTPETDSKAAEFRRLYAVAKTAGADGVGYNDPEAARVDFMGVFDTVVMRSGSFFEAIGLERPDPQYQFHDLRLGDHVLAARQAIAVDERRKSLPLTPWSNVGEYCDARRCKPFSPDAPLQQKWFVGAHGDVGGGQDRDLSEVSRKWVLRGAAAAGLKVDEPLAIAGTPDAPEFLKGKIENIEGGVLSLLGFKDRTCFPEPPDPSVTERRRPSREKATIEQLDQHVHVSSVMRMMQDGLRYTPKPLKPFKDLIDPKNRAFQEWLDTRKREMFA